MSLEFDDAALRRLEVIYGSADVVRRRSLVTAALGARPGEQILDIGCGPGFFVADLASAVQPGGEVTGVDPSPSMLAMAGRRSADRTNVTLLEGAAAALPVADESFDAALCVQVLEYVDDVPRALAEMSRVLRPGGRLVLWDIDWSTVSWLSDDPSRMERVLDAWDAHLVHPALPRRLAADLRTAGFGEVAVEGHAFVNTDTGPDGYSGGLIPLVEDFVATRGIPVGEAAAWRGELEDLSTAGRYFFTVTQFCFSAVAPA